MKTAMQELIIEIKKYVNSLENDEENFVFKQNQLLIYSCFGKSLELAEELLEKEKEQIIQSFRAGNLSFGYGFNAEEFYNKNYKNENNI